VLRRRDLQLVIPTMVVAEATYFVGTRLGSAAEAAFLRGIGDLEVEPPSVDDWPASPISSSATETSRWVARAPR